MTRSKDQTGEAGFSRREALALGGGVVVGCALGGAMHDSLADGVEPRVRPPGALREAEFLAACIRCGQCVQACPSDTLHLTDISDGLAGGTPTFDAKTNPCTMCQGHDGFKCIDACPTGALQPVANERDINIGEAHVRKGRCWAYNGTMCKACWHACPFPNEALRLNELLRPVVDRDVCTGCGLCVQACPADSNPTDPEGGGSSAGNQKAIELRIYADVGSACRMPRRGGPS